MFKRLGTGFVNWQEQSTWLTWTKRKTRVLTGSNEFRAVKQTPPIHHYFPFHIDQGSCPKGLLALTSSASQYLEKSNQEEGCICKQGGQKCFGRMCPRRFCIAEEGWATTAVQTLTDVACSKEEVERVLSRQSVWAGELWGSSTNDTFHKCWKLQHF